jgi:NADH-quinone oxidoreductase subunit G
MAALQGADAVIGVAAFAGEGLKSVAEVILPLAPQAESEGSLVNCDGLTQTYAPAGRPTGQCRSGWRILRRLGSELGVQGFTQVDLDEVRADLQAALDAASPVMPAAPAPRGNGAGAGLYRIGEVAVYAVDPLCRRSAPLQQTTLAGDSSIGLSPADAGRLGLTDGGRARVRQGGGQGVEFEVRVDARVPAGGVWLHSATSAARLLGPAVGPVEVEVAQ